MCPFCKDKPCRVIEQPSGRMMCECGRHQWPSSAVYAEVLRKANLTITGMVHTWTQSF